MTNSFERKAQLRQRLRAIQFFIAFGIFVILLFWVGEILFETKERLLSHHGTVIIARIIFYAFMLPFLFYYYVINSLKDIKKIDTFLVDVTCSEEFCEGILLSNKVVIINNNRLKDEIIIIFGKKYLCNIYSRDTKLFYLPVKDITGLRQ